MKKYNNFINNKLNESAPRIPNSEDYWIKKGKIGKVVMLYFHDDLDGIYSAIVMKNYLEEKNFKIHGYGIVNYTESWSTTTLDPKYINIALDFAENTENIDVYMDHHSNDLENFKNIEKNKFAIKTETTSAYEGICDQLGLPIDSLVQNVIDMIDSAKYDDYNIEQSVLLNFDPKSFKNKLEFAAAFNQLLKRSDYKTFIEVVANTTDKNPSIYNIYRLFRLLYPLNNLNMWELKKSAKESGFDDIDKYIEHLKLYKPGLLKTFQKDFIEDAKWRLKIMEEKTRGETRYSKPKIKSTILSQNDFKKKFVKGNIVRMDGYQILGNLVFVPPGTWANALRARAIVEKDIKKITKKLDDAYNKNNGLIPTIDYYIEEESPLYNDLKGRIGQKLELIGDIKYENNIAKIKIIEDVSNDSKEGIKGLIDFYQDKLIFRAKQPLFWIVLQYGNTFQIASYHKLKNYDERYLPKLKDGTIVKDLGKYCENLLHNFIEYFDYNIDAIENSKTVAGGHQGIGSISNIFGVSHKMISGVKFLDLFKNKIIQDLSGIPWNDLRMSWGDKDENSSNKHDIEYNKRTMISSNIRKID